MSHLFDFAVTTIFAREVLEAAIIIGEYRTIILRTEGSLEGGLSKEQALSQITRASLAAITLALVVIAAIAIPLAVLSNQFDATTSNVIESLSKMVAAVSLLQLSLKIPKWLGVYGSCKKKKKKRNNAEHGDDTSESETTGLTLNSIRFNVAWNIWREVAECGVFLIPFLLSGENIGAIPLSAVAGVTVGFLCGMAIYVANRRFKEKLGLAIFVVLLLVFLSAGLLTGGCHKLELEVGTTRTVWKFQSDFMSVHRLPMTVLKPFGYNDSRTVLEMCMYWSWLLLAMALHFHKHRRAPPARNDTSATPPISDAVDETDAA